MTVNEMISVLCLREKQLMLHYLEKAAIMNKVKEKGYVVWILRWPLTEYQRERWCGQ